MVDCIQFILTPETFGWKIEHDGKMYGSYVRIKHTAAAGSVKEAFPELFRRAGQEGIKNVKEAEEVFPELLHQAMQVVKELEKEE